MTSTWPHTGTSITEEYEAKVATAGHLEHRDLYMAVYMSSELADLRNELYRLKDSLAYVESRLKAQEVLD